MYFSVHMLGAIRKREKKLFKFGYLIDTFDLVMFASSEETDDADMTVFEFKIQFIEMIEILIAYIDILIMISS